MRARVDVREVSCPRCRARTRTVPNPFFGTGLSVHRYIVQCVRCDWTHLVKESERGVSTLRPTVEPVEADEAPEPPKRRLFGRRDN